MAKKILIVEDEKLVRQALSDELRERGFEAVEAIDGEDGLLKAEKEIPDLILLDVVMPKMDGLTMLAKLRKTSWGEKLPVIILTNYGDTDKILKATEGAAYGYLLKSDWNLKDVIKKIEEALAAQRPKE